MATVKDFKNDVKPNWCPGCGDFSVQSAIQRAAANIGLEPEQLAIVSGIGCSGRISGYIRAYGFHGIHGRSLPIAQGVKVANKELTVIAAGGDGDGFAIGIAHTIHAIRRNIDMTYIVMDNQIYGLTKGQTSPRSDLGFVTKSTPKGSVESPLSIMEMALSAGATFVAQGFSSDIKELTEIIQAGINHKGFSLINVFSPCVTYNKINTYEWFRSGLVKTSKIDNYNPTDRNQAMQEIMKHKGLLTGVIYHDQDRKCYRELIPHLDKKSLKELELKISEDEFNGLIKEFM
jgi:2-oxoglutarate ferredoxin oxidoreductase subunit beta